MTDGGIRVGVGFRAGVGVGSVLRLVGFGVGIGIGIAWSVLKVGLVLELGSRSGSGRILGLASRRP